jgi:hypothetical protein
MSLSGFLKAVGLGAAGIAAPFTGGASLSAIPSLLGAGGAGAGAGSQGMASNRGTKFGGQIDLEKLLLERDQNNFLNQSKSQNDAFANQSTSQNDFLKNQISAAQEGRDSGGDAWRRLMSAQHVLSPTPNPNLAGPYTPQSRQRTDAERTGAQGMSAEVLQRLLGGNPISAPNAVTAPTAVQAPNRQITNNDSGFRVDPKLLDPGLLEKILGIASPLLSGVGGLMASRGQGGSAGGGVNAGGGYSGGNWS